MLLRGESWWGQEVIWRVLYVQGRVGMRGREALRVGIFADEVEKARWEALVR